MTYLGQIGHQSPEDGRTTAPVPGPRSPSPASGDPLFRLVTDISPVRHVTGRQDPSPRRCDGGYAGQLPLRIGPGERNRPHVTHISGDLPPSNPTVPLAPPSPPTMHQTTAYGRERTPHHDEPTPLGAEHSGHRSLHHGTCGTGLPR